MQVKTESLPKPWAYFWFNLWSILFPWNPAHESRSCLLSKADLQMLPSLRLTGQSVLVKMFHFLKTNKIIVLDMFSADLPLPVSSFYGHWKSHFVGGGGAHYTSRASGVHLHMKEEVHKSPFLFSNVGSNLGPLSPYRKTQMAYGSFWREGEGVSAF